MSDLFVSGINGHRDQLRLLRSFPRSYNSNFKLCFMFLEALNLVFLQLNILPIWSPLSTIIARPKVTTEKPCAAISFHKGQCAGRGCVIFHLGRTCLLFAWILMSESFPLGMSGAILLRLKFRSGRLLSLHWSFAGWVHYWLNPVVLGIHC